MAELAAGHTGTEAVLADADCVVLESVREIVITLCHRSHKDTYTFFRSQICYVIPHSYYFSVETQGDFAAVRGKMICDRILDDFKELLLRGGRADGEPMQ